MTWQVSTDSQIEPDTDTLHYIHLAHKKKKKKKKKEKEKKRKRQIKKLNDKSNELIFTIG